MEKFKYVLMPCEMSEREGTFKGDSVRREAVNTKALYQLYLQELNKAGKNG